MVLVAGFDADVGAGDEEALWIGAGVWDIFSFGGCDGVVERGGVMANLR